MVPILILIALAFILPLFTPESELPVWQGTYQHIFTVVSDTVVFARLLFNSFLLYSFIPVYAQVILAFLLKCEFLKKYIIVMLSGVGVFAVFFISDVILSGYGTIQHSVELFILPLLSIPLVLTALVLSLLSQLRQRKKILLFLGIILTALPLLLIVYGLIRGFGRSVAIIGGIDGALTLMLFFSLYRPIIGILILGILFIVLSFVLKKTAEKSSEKQENVVE